MKIIKKENAEEFIYADTSKVLEYSIALNEKNLDFCINKISGRYPVKGYTSNLECEELCHILDGEGTIYRLNEEPISFKRDDIIYINIKDIYYWEGDFVVSIVCTPAWSKAQCKAYNDDGTQIN